MSFNGSGTFVINSTGQPVVTGTVISSSTFNSLTADLGTGLSTTVTKDGQTTTTAKIPFALGLSAAAASNFAAGTVGLPAIYLSTDTTTGFYRIGANNDGFAVSGAKVLDIASTGLGVTGTLGVSGATTLSSTLGVTGVAAFAAGAVGAPSIYLGADTTTGLYRIGANNYGFAVSGAKVLDIASTGLAVTGTLTGGATLFSPITNSLSGDVALNNTALYFDGPSVAQGTVGTWFVSGTVTVDDTGGAANFYAKLWDGTTVIASGAVQISAGSQRRTISLSNFITSPAGNLRISCRDANGTTGVILFNQSGNSKDSTITAIRIG